MWRPQIDSEYSTIPVGLGLDSFGRPLHNGHLIEPFPGYPVARMQAAFIHQPLATDWLTMSSAFNDRLPVRLKTYQLSPAQTALVQKGGDDHLQEPN